MQLKFSTRRHQRSDLADEVTKYWVGREKSKIGMQYLQFKDGLVSRSRYIERDDLLLLSNQFTGCDHRKLAVFVYPDGKYRVQTRMDEPKASADEIAACEPHVREAIRENQAFFDYEVAWLQAKPWEGIDGVTPERAVEILREREPAGRPQEVVA